MESYIQNNSNEILLYIIFRCGMTHLNYSIKNLRKTLKLQRDLLKTEMAQDEVFSETWRDKNQNGYIMLRMT